MRQFQLFFVEMERWYLLQSFSFEGIFGISRQYFLNSQCVRQTQNEEYYTHPGR